MSRGLEAFNLSPSERCTTTFLLVVFLSRNLFRTYDSGEEAERLEVLENVGVLCGDEHDVDVVQRMVDVAHRVRLHERVLALRLNIENNLKNLNPLSILWKELRQIFIFELMILPKHRQHDFAFVKPLPLLTNNVLDWHEAQSPENSVTHEFGVQDKKTQTAPWLGFET